MSSSPWVFITTTPSRTRPSRQQRTEIHRRAMREIGASRRAPTEKSLNEPPHPEHNNWISGQCSSDSYQPLAPIPAPAPIALVAPSSLDGDSRILFQHSPCTQYKIPIAIYQTNSSSKCSVFRRFTWLLPHLPRPLVPRMHYTLGCIQPDVGDIRDAFVTMATDFRCTPKMSHSYSPFEGTGRRACRSAVYIGWPGMRRDLVCNRGSGMLRPPSW
jgi:hypothetical protein